MKEILNILKEILKYDLPHHHYLKQLFNQKIELSISKDLFTIITFFSYIEAKKIQVNHLLLNLIGNIEYCRS
jgi:hypothetical protein